MLDYMAKFLSGDIFSDAPYPAPNYMGTSTLKFCSLSDLGNTENNFQLPFKNEHFIYVVLEFELRALCFLSKYLTT
jgi:hypothetical protein